MFAVAADATTAASFGRQRQGGDGDLRSETWLERTPWDLLCGEEGLRLLSDGSNSLPFSCLTNAFPAGRRVLAGETE